MKKVSLIFVIILTFATNISFSQKQGQVRIDSLLLELPKAKEDTNKVMLLVYLAYEYHKTNPDTGKIYGEQALTIAQKIEWKKGISLANNRIGLCYWALSDYPKALSAHFTGLKVAEEIRDSAGIATIYGNIGLVYNDQQEFEQALAYHLKALHINENLKDKKKIALNLGNIGIVYDALGKSSLALEYYLKAIKLYEELGDKGGLARNMGNIAYVYQEEKDYQKALQYNFKALKLNQLLGNKILVGINMGNIGEVYYHIAIDSAKSQAIPLPDSLLYKPNILQQSEHFLQKAIDIFEEVGDQNSLSELYLYLSNLKSFSGKYKESLIAYQQYVAAKDSVFNESNHKKISELEAKRTADIHEKQMEIKDLALSKANSEKRYFIGGICMLICLSGLLYNRYRFKHNANITISQEKERSESLLLNILPAEVAEELKEKGYADAKLIEEVTVLFTDFNGFTQLSEKLSPQTLVKEVNEYFSAFDLIMQKHGVEKIKTIGDSYMAAGGLPTANHTHALDVVKASLEIQQYMHDQKLKKEKTNSLYFDIRIGIHTGPVVAGIVGVKKFAYDIWGDTVNTASRMESSCEVGKINISGSTYELVKSQYHCTHRGKISAKGKGEIDMYFVEAQTK